MVENQRQTFGTEKYPLPKDLIEKWRKKIERGYQKEMEELKTTEEIVSKSEKWRDDGHE